MNSKFGLPSLFLSSCLSFEFLSADSAIHAPEKNTVHCGERPNPMNITLRNTEAKGIGYNQGYTTLEGFFIPAEPWKDAWLPFLDLRGHFFNNGKPAANVGLGIRYLATSRIWGINTYYDYRKTSHKHYQQVSMGLESLGEIWDFRLNGCLPIGDKTSSFFGAKFDQFKGHYAYLTRKYEFAMKGAHAEIGAHVNRVKNVPLYFAMGSYYLEGQGKRAWGGEARVALDIFDYIRLEGNTSYDNLFRWIGQGQLSLRIPFGRKKEIKNKKGHLCSQDLALAQRAVQRVDRHEIIPVDRQHQKKVAINPSTGQPYFFWFVDNTSHSAGTFESPFNTLASAQNASSAHDVIYVFPGDGTTKGMDQGITLKDDQKLFGAGTSQTLVTTWGLMIIPTHASKTPQITCSSTGIVTCANNNEISGLHVRIPMVHGIVCSNITYTLIHDNILEIIGDSLTPSVGIGIFLQNCAGEMLVSHNIFLMNTQFPWGLQLFSTAPAASYLILNNIFQQTDSSFATAIEIGQGNHPSSTIDNLDFLEISGNQFINLGEKSIGGSGLNGTGRLVLRTNTFSGFYAPNPVATVLFRIQTNGNINMQITDNIWENSPAPGKGSIEVQTIANTSQVCVTLTGNSSNISSNAYILNNTAGGYFTADVRDNTGPVQELGNITWDLCP